VQAGVRGRTVIRVQIQFTSVQLAALRRESQRLGVSQSEVVRRSLEVYLGQRSAPDRAAARERARRLLGAFSGGPADVALRHDEYLAEALSRELPHDLSSRASDAG